VRCAHVETIVSRRGSTFILCRLSAADPRFAKYPRLPVLTCAGYSARDESAETGDGTGER
jgi:hypothetical protein